VLRETEVSLAFDGGNNVGMLALFHAAEATIKKTATHGIALVSVTDAWMSGRGAYGSSKRSQRDVQRNGLRAWHRWRGGTG
jgi:LDH2 family malate/lactate/ureidoglycolate dehydrogenase